MKIIEYKVTTCEGDSFNVTVRARDINSGFRKATDVGLRELARSPRSPEYKAWEIHSVAFWAVKD